MIALEVEAPFANFRKSFARSYAETYTLPPPATIYGMVLSLVGERRRRAHLGVHMAIGFLHEPKLAIALRKRSRYKYGVPSKQSKVPNAPDYMEVVCGVEFVLWLDSKDEPSRPSLEERAMWALDEPERIERSGIVCLGLSDDLVDSIRHRNSTESQVIYWLVRDDEGPIELPVWVDHVGSAATRWRRFRTEKGNSDTPPSNAWFTILSPEQL